MKSAILIIVFISICYNINSQTTITIKENKGPIINKKIVNKKTLPADLGMCPVQPNTNTLGTILEETGFPDSFALKIWVCNAGELKAINLTDSLVFVQKINGSYFYSPGAFRTIFNSSITINPNNGREMDYAISVKNGYSKNPSYVFYKVGYTDSKKTKGKLIGIIKLTGFKTNTVLMAAQPTEYDEIISFLKKNHIISSF